ncbi:peptidase S1 [Brevundimonas sp.]|uniref:peptidase S1 n=1 Tax=Brevundimonas sp. TaxID=1871086 RepID=UPI0025F5CF62|nr:peptidase S1 [Brevundimonas sp.]
MRVRTSILGLAAATLVMAAPAVAQDYNLDPNYGWLNLTSGFLPDPVWIPLESGGDIDASGISGDCVGFIAEAPDFRLNFEAGDLPLILTVTSDADTTLVVNGPDTTWYCDDDSGGDLNPAIMWEHPQSGQYDIWVGTYGSTDIHPAALSISEIAGH